MSETHILLARHPETTANVEGRWVGRGNAPFTPDGERQVEELVDAIDAFGPDIVWSSPLERTAVPAGLAAARLGVEHRRDERLIELHFGDAEGLTLDEASERGIEFHFKSERTPVAPGGESRRDILERTRSVDADIVASASRSAVVTHGGVFRSALVDLLGLDASAIWAFHIKNAQLAYVRIIEERGILESFARLGEPLP